VLEQIPGFIKAHDVTYELRKQGYWASYNVPFYATIAEMSGVSRQCYRGLLPSMHCSILYMNHFCNFSFRLGRVLSQTLCSRQHVQARYAECFIYIRLAKGSSLFRSE
jgi:hypothetical protein